MKYLQEPEFKPYCCSQQTKWVCISPSLYYFYCEVCKKEVESIVSGGSSPKTSNFSGEFKTEAINNGIPGTIVYPNSGDVATFIPYKPQDLANPTRQDPQDALFDLYNNGGNIDLSDLVNIS